jgi:hypothetical protein
VKRMLLLCLAAGLLALPATASAYVALHGRAKIAVVYDGYANGLGNGLGNPSRPPSNAAIHQCFDAWQAVGDLDDDRLAAQPAPVQALGVERLDDHARRSPGLLGRGHVRRRDRRLPHPR